mmetsp:Transcript_12915/g.29701  ORF Transcript_12915/g.29701 Transcript_12915/m.29701 type:complete len:241 (-) Transcript_12915:2698-3420(-)
MSKTSRRLLTTLNRDWTWVPTVRHHSLVVMLTRPKDRSEVKTPALNLVEPKPCSPRFITPKGPPLIWHLSSPHMVCMESRVRSLAVLANKSSACLSAPHSWSMVARASRRPISAGVPSSIALSSATVLAKSSISTSAVSAADLAAGEKTGMRPRSSITERSRSAVSGLRGGYTPVPARSLLAMVAQVERGSSRSTREEMAAWRAMGEGSANNWRTSSDEALAVGMRRRDMTAWRRWAICG